MFQPNISILKIPFVGFTRHQFSLCGTSGMYTLDMKLLKLCALHIVAHANVALTLKLLLDVFSIRSSPASKHGKIPLW